MRVQGISGKYRVSLPLRLRTILGRNQALNTVAFPQEVDVEVWRQMWEPCSDCPKSSEPEVGEGAWARGQQSNS